MKLNYIGIVAGIIAFISLALPWWTMTMSIGGIGTRISVDASIYPYQATASSMGVSQNIAMALWFGTVALVLIVIAGIAGIVGSVIVGKTGKTILIVAGILALLSILIFAVGLHGELSKTEIVSGYPIVGLFSSNSWSIMGTSLGYSTYLSFGFWLALVATIITFVAYLMHPTAVPTTESP